MTQKEIEQEIEKLVNEYADSNSKELLRAQLQYLVLLAERYQGIAS